MTTAAELTTRLNAAFMGNTSDVKAAAAAATGSTSSATLDQASFLKLFTTQVQNQDPFEPMDNSQMVAQMAQFSSVAGITEMNASLKVIGTELGGSRIAAASSWIGRSMLVESNIATPDRLGQYGGELTLPKDSDAVTVDFIDGDGSVVKTVDLGAQKAGTAAFYWDGTDGEGNKVSSDALRLRVNGATPTSTATWTSIAGVQSPGDSSATKLITPLGSFDPADAIRIG